MAISRKIEILSAGCPVCADAVRQIQDAACPSCEIEVLDIRDPTVSERAVLLGVRSVPAVVIDGVLAGCCSDRGVDVAMLQAAGLGKNL